MKKILLTMLLLVCIYTQAFALSFNFSGSTDGGTGSATMDFSTAGNTLTLLLQNTSPTLLDDNSEENAPGITGFGFNVMNSMIPVNWDLWAYDKDKVRIKIGSSVDTEDYYWTLSISQASITLDYLTKLKDIKGALYNPLATAGLAAAPNYFTDAELTMTFSSAPVLDLTPVDIGSGLTGSVYVRMQNVGEDGEGSLKLVGKEVPSVPEPSTLLLLGAGLAGLGWYGRKRSRKQL